MRSAPLAAMALSLLLAACGSSDCEDACEAGKDCPLTAGFLQGIPCDEACDQQQSQSESAGCLPQWETWQSCLANSLGENCQATGNGCVAENQAWSSCIDPSVP